MSRTICVAVAFVFASAVAQAQQKCSSGVGEPSDDEPKNVVSLLQSKRQINEVARDVVSLLEVIRGEVMLHPACAERKLVINSHVKYGQQLDRLVASLKKHKFPLNDCVVFRGGASTSAGPHAGPDGMTFVDLTVDSYDLNALAGLSLYNNHSLVCADMYFLIHDSTQIGPCFPKAFAEVKVAPTEVITPGLRHFSNQCVFGRSVVDKFGNDFIRDVDKGRGFLVDGGVCAFYSFGNPKGKTCSINHYASKRSVIPERVPLGDADVYHDSLPRTAFWYQEWDLYKFILRDSDRRLWHTSLVRPDGTAYSASESEINPGSKKEVFQTDLALSQQDYTLAPSCSRKCTVEDIDSTLCKRRADA